MSLTDNTAELHETLVDYAMEALDRTMAQCNARERMAQVAQTIVAEHDAMRDQLNTAMKNLRAVEIERDEWRDRYHHEERMRGEDAERLRDEDIISDLYKRDEGRALAEVERYRAALGERETAIADSWRKTVAATERLLEESRAQLAALQRYMRAKVTRLEHERDAAREAAVAGTAVLPMKHYAISPSVARFILAELDIENERRQLPPTLVTIPAADREALGREVRRVWMEWAAEQPAPKPSWLVPWEDLDEPSREVDRRIGEALVAQPRRERDEARAMIRGMFERLAVAAGPMDCPGCAARTTERDEALAALRISQAFRDAHVDDERAYIATQGAIVRALGLPESSDAVSLPEHVERVVRERDEARSGRREAAQVLIAEIGASGPESVIESARRAVAALREARAQLAALRVAAETARGYAGLRRDIDEAAAAYRALDAALADSAPAAKAHNRRERAAALQEAADDCEDYARAQEAASLRQERDGEDGQWWRGRGAGLRECAGRLRDRAKAIESEES